MSALLFCQAFYAETDLEDMKKAVVPDWVVLVVVTDHNPVEVNVDGWPLWGSVLVPQQMINNTSQLFISEYLYSYHNQGNF